MEARWVLLGRVLRVAAAPVPQEDAEAEPAAAAAAAVPEEGVEAEPAAAAADDDDFSIMLVLPLRVTVITANPSAQHDPVDPDRYPYVLAASAFCVLVNFSVLPFYGVQFGDHPHDPHLVLVRDREFHHPEAGVCTATAQGLPSRHGSLPIIYNLESIGLVTRLRVGANEEHVVAELFVDKGSESASIAYWSAELYDWQHKEGIVYPLAAHRDRDWVPSGVVSHDEKTWWFDLSWGILSSDFSHLPTLTLLFHDLPVGRALDASQPDIRHRRCITESGNALRYVEIISDGDASATVCLWTGIPVPNDDGHGILVWDMMYEVGFEEIWDDDTYKATGLPHKVPVLTAVCPTNPALVYFCLEQEQRLFGVDVPLHTVVQFVDEAYDLVMPWPAPLCSRYVLPWLLPPQVLQALGIDPFMDEPPGAIKSRKDTPRSTESGDDTIGSEEPGDNATGSDESGNNTAGSDESEDNAAGSEESEDNTAESQELGPSVVTESGDDATESSEPGGNAAGSDESEDNTAGSEESGVDVTDISEAGDDAIGSEESGDNTAGSQESGDDAAEVSESGDGATGSDESGYHTAGSQESGDDATEDSSE